jgi:hypothetical protein
MAEDKVMEALSDLVDEAYLLGGPIGRFRIEVMKPDANVEKYAVRLGDLTAEELDEVLNALGVDLYGDGDEGGEDDEGDDAGDDGGDDDGDGDGDDGDGDGDEALSEEAEEAIDAAKTVGEVISVLVAEFELGEDDGEAMLEYLEDLAKEGVGILEGKTARGLKKAISSYWKAIAKAKEEEEAKAEKSKKSRKLKPAKKSKKGDKEKPAKKRRGKKK